MRSANPLVAEPVACPRDPGGFARMPGREQGDAACARMIGERADLCGRCGRRLFEHDVQSRVDRRRRDRMAADRRGRSEEHTSAIQSLMRISYAVFCLKKKNKPHPN